MASKFAQYTGSRGEGIYVEEWLKTMADPAIEKGINKDVLVNIKTQNETKQLSANQCAVLFNNPQLNAYQSLNNTQSSGMAIVARPVDFVSFIEAIRISTESNSTYTAITRPYLIVPIIEFSTDQKLDPDIKALVGQCGAQWIGQGDPFKYEYNQDNCALMFTYSLQSLILAICNEEKQKNSTLYSKMLYHICKSAKSYFAMDNRAFNVIKPLFNNQNAIDMLNRATIINLFSEKGASKRDILGFMEISLKRIFRRNRWGVNFFKYPSLISGIFGIIVILPMFRKCFNEKITNAKTISAEIKKITLEYAQHFKETKEQKENIHSFNKNIIYIMFKLGEFEITKEQSDKLYNFCSNLRNFTIPAPFVELGLIKTVPTDFRLVLTEFYHHNIFTLPVLFTGERDTKIYSIISRDDTKWSAIGLNFEGEYCFIPQIIGNSEQALGNSVREHHKSILRVTTGYDILPNRYSEYPREGLASSGILYSRKNGIWCYSERNLVNDHVVHYQKVNNILDLTKSFTLRILKNTFSIEQEGNIWYNGTFIDHVTLAFKFLSLKFTYTKDITIAELEETGIAEINKLSTQGSSSKKYLVF